MGKEDSKSKIIIKINGEENVMTDENKETLLSMAETAASTASESADESFDWILPEPDRNDDTNSLSPYIVKTNTSKASIKALKLKKLKSLFPSMWISIVLAVVVGTSLGFIVLKTVTSKHLPGEETAAVPARIEAEPVSAKNNTRKSASLTIPPPLTAYVVQGGIFSTEKGAKMVQDTVSQKGIPARVLDMDQKFVLILGVSENLQNAKSLAITLKERNVDSFWKELKITGISKKKLSSKEAMYLKDLTTVFTMLSEKSSSKLMDTGSATKGESLKSAIEKVEKHDSLSHKNLSEMEKSIKEASSLYLSSSGEESLFQTQAKLLDFLVLYSEL